MSNKGTDLSRELMLLLSFQTPTLRIQKSDGWRAKPATN